MTDDFAADGLARNFVAGEWRGGDGGESIAVEDPASEERVLDAAIAGSESLDVAIGAAKDCVARGAISDMLPAERAALLRRIAAEIRTLAQKGSPLLARESGKRLEDAQGEFAEAAAYFEYYSGLADKIEGRSIPLGPGLADFTVLEPYGISAQIIPWNYPVSLAARSLAPALAAGNCAILKAPELDPAALLMLGHAIDRAGVPKGAVSILNGIGADLGARLVRSPDVDQIVFTGSVATGQAILHAAADIVTPALVELGGKSAAIAYADADADALVESVKWGIFNNAGQVCSAMSRLLVHRSRHAEIMERLVAMAGSLSVGDGLSNHDHTPQISAAQLDRVEAMVARARSDGQEVATGGARIDRPGHFMAPTILDNVDPASPIAQEEVFGPVLCVTPFDSEDEAIALANGTEFGLVAGLFTRDIGVALRTANRLRAGQVFVNKWFAGGIQTPFGGVGKSGFGREKGAEALLNYVRTKNIAVALD
ncbi:aldehyde dehydrogenase family protein [Paraurantiacibacter namhicola]|uniref:Betaine aldehyde dehydrogenase n=1 Tax=Paraurantiacibacter namhicola TaxID=645517 RepID=A0A1C7D4S4_9SPHN|nr:aldehyde dehydrogenase family protein [Paraurantiacibacter namhicola]ANU06449.1 Betaine aldehyde dehydrogenase [Paraurantiacibacter namhicola]